MLSTSNGWPRKRSLQFLGLIVLGMTTLLFVALITDGYHRQGDERRFIDGMTLVPNWLGRPGAAVAAILAIVAGDAAHVVYAVFFIWGLMLCTHRPLDRFLTRLLGLVILMSAFAGLLQLDVATGVSNPEAGGLLGAYIMDRFFAPRFGLIGANVIGATLAAIGLLLTTDFLVVRVLMGINRILLGVVRAIWTLIAGTAGRFRRRGEDGYPEDTEIMPDNGVFPEPPRREIKRGDKLSRIRVRTEPDPPVEQDLPFMGASNPAQSMKEPAHNLEPDDEQSGAGVASRGIRDNEGLSLPAPAPNRLAQLEFGVDESADFRRKGKPRAVRKTVELDELPPDYEYPRFYTKPPVSMLDAPEPRIIGDLKEQLRQTGLVLEETLRTFNIEARVTDVTRGPTITRFELEPAPGVKVSRFLALADDIALALKAQRVRVEAPIPGKGRVGIEVPNRERDPVVIRELLENRAFSRGRGKLNLALGKDISGEVRIADLAGMPHLLVAGATGAGKTVCVKALLASLLFQHTPDELQLMLIDPKMVELSIFNDIPHLITPVVTEPKKAASALNWLITEMEERYRLFADLRVRNIEVYNQSVENGEIEIEGGGDGHSLHVVRKLPYIVCVIDELADLMMLVRSEVEDAIARLAQLARAVGIHLIIATQRPSVDVLTGVIKANFPARLSFQVSSRVDSRCILDEIGAERLIGMGDLLYLPAGQSKPTRIQGAFVSDDEMNALIAYLKRQAPPQYRDEIERFGKGKEASAEMFDEDDPLFDEAVQVVLETAQASISMVQRRLRVGYTRAARLIDMMELRGIVGPHIGSKARDILVSTPPKDEVA